LFIKQEFDTPANLIRNPYSEFLSMIQNHPRSTELIDGIQDEDDANK
jgi:hypothetical protein